jgi:hypothetical protein
MKPLFVFCTFAIAFAATIRAESESSNPPAVPYPDGYRQWQHVNSVVMPAKMSDGKTMGADGQPPAPHGLIFNVYANEKAQEGYRTGHFPEGSVLIADWFFLEEKGPALMQGARKSVDVMIRDARYAETGGWGFENFDRDSRTIRNVGSKAVKSCFECHSRAKEHEFVFSSLQR